MEITPEIIDIGSLTSNDNIIELKRDSSFSNDLNIETIETIETIKPIQKPSANFGYGIELLMNDKKFSGGGGNKARSTSIDIDDITDLENELNNLADTVKFDEPYREKSSKSIFSNLFNVEPPTPTNTRQETQPAMEEINLGKKTAEYGETKTWDGYGQFQNIPMDPDMNVSSTPKLSKEELEQQALEEEKQQRYEDNAFGKKKPSLGAAPFSSR